MRKQFDSCSYKELTQCVKARIDWIREGRRFLKDPYTKKYSHVRAKVALAITVNKFEIERLLKMRRALKQSDLKNWDSDRLSI